LNMHLMLVITWLLHGISSQQVVIQITRSSDLN
jgi:hypothetical protein